MRKHYSGLLAGLIDGNGFGQLATADHNLPFAFVERLVGGSRKAELSGRHRTRLDGAQPFGCCLVYLTVESDIRLDFDRHFSTFRTHFHTVGSDGQSVFLFLHKGHTGRCRSRLQNQRGIPFVRRFIGSDGQRDYRRRGIAPGGSDTAPVLIDLGRPCRRGSKMYIGLATGRFEHKLLVLVEGEDGNFGLPVLRIVRTSRQQKDCRPEDRYNQMYVQFHIP